MSTTTPHTDILAFAPVPAQVVKGDKVTFVNDSMARHTGTFSTSSRRSPTRRTRRSARRPRPVPQNLNSKDMFNTGLLPPNAPPGAAPPEAVRSFTFSVPAAGEYQYICILHAPSGIGGAIKAS